MEAKELRIGNYLRDKISKTELEVIELTKDNIVTYVIDRSKFPLQNGWGLEPIPLTEDILLKCVFKFKEKGFNDLSVSYGLANEKIHFVIDNYYHKLTYLHELQNLYFALTNQELKITL